MSKRVYEIARELDLESKEVISRLREAGVEVKSHSSSVEDPIYERVFGDSAGEAAASNGRTEAQEAEAREARAEAERSGHGATIAASAEEPISEPKDEKKDRGKKRRRVVIDASATNRGARPAAVPTSPREPEQTPVAQQPEKSAAVRVEPGATVKDLAEALGRLG